jgi:uncharacterized protein (TIGR00730 family)
MRRKNLPDKPPRRPSILESVGGLETQFLTGTRDREADLESAVRVFLEFLKGFESMEVDRPCVTVFGSARFKEDHPYYAMARELGGHLARGGFAVMTGGGPGIMEAANRGAQEAGGLSIGCNIVLPQEQNPNAYLDRFVEFDHFFVRKVMLVKYSCAFVVMPGGYGTLDEIFETLTLIQTGKIARFPIVALGTDFWEHLLEFYDNALLDAGTISRSDARLVRVTDSPKEAVTLIQRGLE